MKFLVDVGVGKKVENWLKGNGFDVLSVRDIDSRAKDLQNKAGLADNVMLFNQSVRCSQT